MQKLNCPKCGKQMTKGNSAQSGKRRWECRAWEAGSGKHTYCYSTTNPGGPMTDKSGNRSKRPIVFKRPLRPEAKTFIITSAQNATPVHPGFWDCLQTARKALNAELLVVPIRYKNPTSRWTASQKNEESWAAEVTPYLYNHRHALNKNLLLLGDIKTQPTASDPLSGFESISGGESAIIAHTKLQLRSVATPSNKMAKVITTTGACTVQNYTDSKAGKKGEFHHALAAVIVEIDGPIFHVRHVNYDKKTESFTDLETRYKRARAVRAPKPLALVMGDTHVDFIDPKVEAATDEMIAILEPAHLIWHDLLDGYAANPHHFGNPFNAFAKRQSGADDVKKEVFRAIDHVLKKTPDGTVSIVVSSNHNDFLRRWVITNDWREDPTNAEFYLATAWAMIRDTKMGPGGTEYPSPFPYWFKERVGVPFLKQFKTLGGNESFMLGGVELGMHGDRGPNGSKGSARNLRRVGVRSIIGHSHSPEINEGCYQVGTSTRLRLEYNSGPSSWLNAHCILHQDGKRQLVIIVNGKWRLQ